MHSFACKLALFSFLFMSIEGAADIVIDGIPHGDPASHQQEFGHSLEAHESEVSDSELDGEHCDHCCHGHSSSMVQSHFTDESALTDNQVQDPYDDLLPDLLLTPPTPPPDPQNLS